MGKWLTVKAGSFGTHGRLFNAGRYYVEDEAIINAALEFPDNVTVEDGDAPASTKEAVQPLVNEVASGMMKTSDLAPKVPAVEAEAPSEEDGASPAVSESEEEAPTPKPARKKQKKAKAPEGEDE